MFTQKKLALAIALVLSSGVAALANDRDGEEDNGCRRDFFDSIG